VIAVALARDGRKFLHILKRADYMYVPYILLFTFLAYVFSSLGYVFVSKVFRIKAPKPYIFIVAMVTIAVNNLMAFGGVAGYTLRVFLMKSKKVGTDDVIASSFFHTYLYTISVTAFVPVMLFILFSRHILDKAQSKGLLYAGFGSLAFFVFFSLIFFKRSFRLKLFHYIKELIVKVFKRDPEKGLNRFDEVVKSGLDYLITDPYYIPLLLSLTILDYASAILAFHFCFKATGTAVSGIVLVTGFIIGTSAGTASMIPGGLGVQETSMAAIYSLFGVTVRSALLASILYRVFFYFIPIILSMIAYKLISGDED